MGEQLPPEPVPPGKQPAGIAEEHLEIAGEGALLAALFAGGFERLVIEGEGVGIVNDARAGGGDVHRDDDVIEQRVGGDGCEKGAANGVDRAGAADAGVHARFGGAEGLFHAPVGIDASPGGAARGLDLQCAADRADTGIGEVRGQSGDGVGGEPLAGVGEDDDLAGDEGEGGVEAGGFAGAGWLCEDVYARRIECLGASDRGIGRAVGDEEDAEFFRRVVGGQQVLDTRADAGFLIVRHDEDAHVGRIIRQLARHDFSPAREPRHEGGIADKRVGHRAEAEPEDDGGDVGSHLHRAGQVVPVADARVAHGEDDGEIEPGDAVPVESDT